MITVEAGDIITPSNEVVPAVISSMALYGDVLWNVRMGEILLPVARINTSVTGTGEAKSYGLDQALVVSSDRMEQFASA